MDIVKLRVPSRPCPGQLQKTTRSKETLNHSQGLDLDPPISLLSLLHEVDDKYSG